MAQCDLSADDFKVTFGQSRKNKRTKSGDYVGAWITVNPKYLSAELVLPPFAVNLFRQNPLEFQKIVYHEISHILIDPLYLDQYDQLSPIEQGYFNEKREQAVEKVSRIGWLSRIRKEDLTNAKRKLRKTKC